MRSYVRERNRWRSSQRNDESKPETTGGRSHPDAIRRVKHEPERNRKVEIVVSEQ